MTDIIGFSQKRMSVQLTLRQGEFKSGGNSKIINDLAMTATVEKLGPPDFGKASVSIKGMKLEDMEQLTTLAFYPLMTNRNYINIFAGDGERGLTQIFAGSIVNASADLSSADKIFKIEAQLGFWGSVQPCSPNAVKGTQSAASFIESMAIKSEMNFENQGLNTTITNCVFNGSPVQQARQCALQVGAELLIDDEKMILKPQNEGRKGNVIELSKDSGLLGYPNISQSGIECKAIFNPGFQFGGLFNLKTIVPKCSGTWRITRLAHNISANDPSTGQWESSITGFYPEFSSVYGRF